MKKVAVFLVLVVYMVFTALSLLFLPAFSFSAEEEKVGKPGERTAFMLKGLAVVHKSSKQAASAFKGKLPRNYSSALDQNNLFSSATVVFRESCSCKITAHPITTLLFIKNRTLRL